MALFHPQFYRPEKCVDVNIAEQFLRYIFHPLPGPSRTDPGGITRLNPMYSQPAIGIAPAQPDEILLRFLLNDYKSVLDIQTDIVLFLQLGHQLLLDLILIDDLVLAQPELLFELVEYPGL